jgi:hypothetical protein
MAQMKGSIEKSKINDFDIVKLLPLPQPPMRARTDARTNPSTQRATQLRRVLARVYAVSIQNQITTTVFSAVMINSTSLNEVY